MDCGDLRCGFARVWCESGRKDLLLAYSCKRRCFCPSCHQKRALLFAEHIEQDLLGDLPIRQSRRIVKQAQSSVVHLLEFPIEAEVLQNVVELLLGIGARAVQRVAFVADGAEPILLLLQLPDVTQAQIGFLRGIPHAL